MNSLLLNTWSAGKLVRLIQLHLIVMNFYYEFKLFANFHKVSLITAEIAGRADCKA